MCAIVGALLGNVAESDLEQVNGILNHIIKESQERGRDGWGYAVGQDGVYDTVRAVPEIIEWAQVPALKELPRTIFKTGFRTANFIMNLRAEPTTEYVAQKALYDQQPYSVFPYHVVHNGTIANDKNRRTYRLKTNIDSAAIPETLNIMQIEEADADERLRSFAEGIHTLQGSWAVLATRFDNTSEIFAAVNYRPIWMVTTRFGFFFASSRSYFPTGMVPEMLTPYSQHVFGIKDLHPYHKSFQDENDYFAQNRALVVCSGGLDSTVAASTMIQSGYDVELIHFQYGSRAEAPEVRAVEAIAERLGVPHTLFKLPVYKPSDSPLLQADSAIAGGEAGAEFAYEWVPARNLLLLSVATAYAEAHGFGVIVLGNNLEEAGAYPDNEPEFVHKFNDILPFAVGVNRKIRVVMPVGNLMKHEIVKLGVEVKAPLDLTWSCYRAGEKHCGTCGPCFMRRTAFKINNIPEVIDYAS